MTSLGTLLRTVRHLKPGQVIGRIRFRFFRPAFVERPAPVVRQFKSRMREPARRNQSLFGSSSLRFLNVEYSLDTVGWDDPTIDRLWRYNSHYFDDLNAQDNQTRVAAHRALVSRWISENPGPHGTGWEPYPVSLRVVNWIKWKSRHGDVDSIWLDSLANQVRWLRRRLEYHLLGNHLFVNAKALVFAGIFFCGDEADEWLEMGMGILERELSEQILEDGAHFELSPMYHALAFEDVLDLISVCEVAAETPKLKSLQKNLLTIAPKMCRWLVHMARPDQTLSQFNDCAEGVAPSLCELLDYAARLGVVFEAATSDGLVDLRDSGYVRLARGSALAVLDLARIGPDYLPGHAHADTLSFELSLGRRAILVNGGTSCYGSSPRRLKERGTGAHNTVQIAGENSSEVWSGFRVGRRARPVDKSVDRWRVTCSHDGYRFLRGRPRHRRVWQLDESSLLVEDQISVSTYAAVARFFLSPGLRAEALDETRWRIVDQNAVVAEVEVLQGRARVVDALHAPEFGVLLRSQCLEVELADGCARTRWNWNSDAHSLSH